MVIIEEDFNVFNSLKGVRKLSLSEEVRPLNNVSSKNPMKPENEKNVPQQANKVKQQQPKKESVGSSSTSSNGVIAKNPTKTNPKAKSQQVPVQSKAEPSRQRYRDSTRATASQQLSNELDDAKKFDEYVKWITNGKDDYGLAEKFLFRD